MTLAEQKSKLRDVAKDQRKNAVLHAGSEAELRFTENLLKVAEKILVDSDAVVGGYMAMSNELSVSSAMTSLIEHFGATCALPVVVGKNTPLIFREWTPGMELESGGFNTVHPPESAPECTPNILLVPLLAYDLTGYRVGWGGGFYDRTLDKLKCDGRDVIAIGSAYAGQQMASVVHGELDQPMDWIVTERSAVEVDHE